MYGDYSYQILQYLQQHLPNIEAALTTISSTISNIANALSTFQTNALAFMGTYKVYILALVFLSFLGYIYGRRNLQ